jgi:hypothetical protein
LGRSAWVRVVPPFQSSGAISASGTTCPTGIPQLESSAMFSTSTSNEPSQLTPLFASRTAVALVVAPESSSRPSSSLPAIVTLRSVRFAVV